MTKRYTVEFNAKITPVKPINDEFTLCKCYVMALNKNRNLSFISQDTADAAIPTLFNIPVIGHLYIDDEGKYHMGGHDMTIVQNNDGQYEFKSICVPYGVVPQQDSVHYEDVQEPDGDTRTYLVADVILWTGRFPELYEAIYNDQTYFGQSMEINVAKYAPLDEDKNYTNITEYSYSALCLLGKSDNPEFHTEPCFPMSRVDAYEFSIDDAKFSELMAQLKGELAACFEFDSGKGGECMSEINETTTDVEEVQEIFEEGISATDAVVTTVDVPVEGVVEEINDVAPKAFTSTYHEKREAISESLPFVEEIAEDGEPINIVHYWLCDFDDTYAYVERDLWRKDDGHSETKGRFSYTYIEESKTASITGEFEEMFVKWLTKDESDSIESMRNQYQELLDYRNDRERADREASYDEVISDFEDLEGNEEFATICESRYSYESVEILRNVCYAIRGKLSVHTAKPKVNAEPFIPVVNIANHREEITLRDRFHAKYGSK